MIHGAEIIVCRRPDWLERIKWLLCGGCRHASAWCWYSLWSVGLGPSVLGGRIGGLWTLSGAMMLWSWVTGLGNIEEVVGVSLAVLSWMLALRLPHWRRLAKLWMLGGRALSLIIWLPGSHRLGRRSTFSRHILLFAGIFSKESAG